MPKLIFVIDDEKNIREIIRSYLEKENFSVMEFDSAEPALEAFKRYKPDMLVVDIMMPGMSGFELCNEVRKIDNTPIIIVSARDEELDRILGIEMGADHYMMKPFSPRELVARVKAVFRRIDGMNEDRSEVEPSCRDLKIYPTQRRVVKVEGETETGLIFTAMGYDFLFYMISNKRRVFTRNQLLSSIWDYQYIGDTRAVDDLVKRIRKKLDAAQTAFQIDTVWGYGYKVTDSAE